MNSDFDKKTDFARARNEVSDQVGKGARQATDILTAAGDGISEKATDAAEEGKEALLDQANVAQKSLSSALVAFGGAIRAASEHLANSDQRTASKFALEAAGGLERMSASLKDKPFEDVLGEMRAFGSQNPGVLVGGAIVAGLALGRFIKSSAPDAAGPAARSGTDVGRAGKDADQ